MGNLFDEKGKTGQTGQADDEIASRTKKMYDAYHSGEISRDDWIIYLIKSLEKYIDVLLKERSYDRHSSVRNSACEDGKELFEDCCLTIINKGDEFNPYLGTLTTFFKPQLLATIHECRPHKFGSSPSLDKDKQKMIKRLRELGQEGLTEELINNPSRLAEMTGFCLSRVQQILAAENTSVCSLDDFDDNLSSTRSYGQDPFEKFVQKQQSEDIEKMLRTCTPLERFLLEQIYMDEQENYKSLAEILNKDQELRKKFNLKGVINAQYIQGIVENAKFRLRNSKQVTRLYVNKRTGDFVDGTEQIEFQMLIDQIDKLKI